MSETGPIYGVELIDNLPLNPGQTGGMRQAMPSRSDLEGIRNYRQGQRVVAGYEVLLNHWRKRGEEVERLQAIVDNHTNTARRLFSGIVELDIRLLCGCYLANGEDGVWWLYRSDGEGLFGGTGSLVDVIEQLAAAQAAKEEAK